MVFITKKLIKVRNHHLSRNRKALNEVEREERKQTLHTHNNTLSFDMCV